MITAAVIAQGYFLVGGLLVLFAGIFDMFDGALARARNASSTYGAFLDSTLDRYSESIILFGLFFYALQRFGLHDPLWPFPYEQPWMIALIYIAGIGSLMVSYAKARAEGLGLECKTGLLARPERVVILAIGLLTGAVMWALVLLAIFSHVTAIERIIHVGRVSHKLVKVGMADVLIYETHDSANNRHLPTTNVVTNEVNEPSIRPVPTSVPPFNGGAHSE